MKSCRLRPKKFAPLWIWLVFLVGAMAMRADAHTDQEQPAFVDILPQRSFLVVRITGSANDLSDAIVSGSHSKTAPKNDRVDSDLDTRAEVNSYLDHHVLLTQGGQRLQGTLQTLRTYPNTFDDSKDDFEAVYRYRRDPALAEKPLHASSILFNFLGKSHTVVSLDGSARTLSDGEETQFDGATTLPSLSRNVLHWFNLGLVHLFSSFELVSFFGVLLCAAAYRSLASLLAAAVGFTLAQSAGFIFSLTSTDQLSARMLSVSLAFPVVVMGLYAWTLARGSESPRSDATRGFIPLAIVFGFVFGLPLGPTFGERGLPQEGLAWCITGFTLGSILTSLVASGLGFLLLKRLRAKYEHESQYGGISWPCLLQWASGSVGGIGAFWFFERLLS